MYSLVFVALLAVVSADPTNLYGAGLVHGHGGLVYSAPAIKSVGYASKINHVAHAAPVLTHAAPIAVAHHAPIAVAHHAPIAVAPHAIRSVAYSSKINHVAAAPVLAHAAPIVGPIGYAGPIGYGHGGVIGLNHAGPIGYGHGGVIGLNHAGPIGYGHGGVIGLNHAGPIGYGHGIATKAVGYSSKINHVAVAPIAVAHAAPVAVAPLALNYKGSPYLH